MVSDVPFGVLLSGGVDSSLNVALMSELMNRPGDDVHDRLRRERGLQRVPVRAAHRGRYKTDHHETLINGEEAQNFLPLLVRLQDEPIADNVCIPLYFLAKLVKQSGTTVVQVGEGADENFLGYWWCEHYRQKYESVYRPARARLAGLAAVPAGAQGADAGAERRRSRDSAAGRGRPGAVLGRRRLLVGRDARSADAEPRSVRAGDRLSRSRACCLIRYRRSTATPSCGTTSAPLDGRLREPEVLQKIPYMEMKLRLPEHLLMRVDKLTMAHAVEARVPFLDHDVVEFATRLPPSYKLRDGVGKRILKKAAEPYIDHDLIYRRKQGFGAPMEEWFREGDFGRRCLAAFERSELTQGGLFRQRLLRRIC